MAGVVVVDEAHRALAPTIRDVLGSFRQSGNTHVVGLTATPGRAMEKDKENEELARLFDHNLITAECLGPRPIRELQDRGVLARLRRELVVTNVRCPFDGSGLRGVESQADYSAKVLHSLATNQARNDLILQAVHAKISRGRQVLVFACTVEHARDLCARTAMDGGASAVLDYSTGRDQRERVIGEFRGRRINALFNFGILSTGFDAPNVHTVIIARPTTSIVLYSQMLGRGIRGPRMGGTSECLLVDVKDNFENFGYADRVYNFFLEYWEE